MHYVTGSREEELMSVFGNLQNHPLHHNKTADSEFFMQKGSRIKSAFGHLLTLVVPEL